VTRLNPTEPPELHPRTTEEMLSSLCNLQGERIKELHRFIDQLERDNKTLGGKLLAEGEERKAHLKLMQTELAMLREQTKKVVNQRDTIERALRSLYSAFVSEAVMAHQTPFPVEVIRAIEETEELLIVIDQMKGGK